MEEVTFENRIHIDRIREASSAIQKAMSKVLVGQTETVELMLAAMLSSGHLLLEGVPGVAKTLSAKGLARTIDIGFSRIQFTPDLMPSDVMGTNVFNPISTQFEFRPGPIFSHIVLIDEINRAPAKTQSALFEVMEERRITVDRHSHELKAPFMVIATQNPVEHEGTYRLPEAQLDRFAFKLVVDYPNVNEEIEILERHQGGVSMHRLIEQIDKVISADELLTLMQVVSEVNIERKLLAYIAQLVQRTRQHRSLLLGASPRASVTLLNTAKAIAALQGRDFVIPDDIVRVSIPALRHRITLHAEKEMEGQLPEDIIRDILQEIEIPR
jgi:MoxR-like ATPase